MSTLLVGRACLRLFLILCLSILTLPVFAKAESIVWNSMAPNLCFPGTSQYFCGGPEAVLTVEGITLQITYNARVTNEATGAIIPKGATVPAGTRVKYEFVPHLYTDIYWVGTGGIYDSPYGDWTAGAGMPGGSLCQPKNGPLPGYTYWPMYATLSVSPPTKTVAGLPTSCEVAADGVSRICTLSNAGQINAVFNYAPTVGAFYGALSVDCVGTRLLQMGGGDSTYSASGPYTLSVPARSINHNINVEAAANTAPNTPTLTSGGACVVGQAHTITMSATDPDGNQIRYGIDWNADGSVDEWMPPTGYVPSGTQQSASRTYATEGSKTVKVLTEDQGGLSSAWASLSFTCATPPPPPEEDPDDTDNGNGGPGSGDSCPLGHTLQNGVCVFSGCPTGYTFQNGVCVENQPTQCAENFSCVSATRVRHTTAQCIESFTDCQTGWSCVAGQCIPPQVGGNITAAPTLVRPDDTTTIAWTSSEMESCSVVSVPPRVPSNADSEGLSGSFTSSPLNQKTVFTLFCITTEGDQFSDSATVNILPTFQEN